MDHGEQLTALRGLYEGLALEKDDVERENVRLAAQLAEARRGLVEAQARAKAAELEAEQLRRTDRAVRWLLARVDALTVIGEADGTVTLEALRLAADKGEVWQEPSPGSTRLRAASELP